MILLYLWPGHRISFVISRTWLNRGSLNGGSTVIDSSLYRFFKLVFLVRKKELINQTITSHSGQGLDEIRQRGSGMPHQVSSC